MDGFTNHRFHIFCSDIKLEAFKKIFAHNCTHAMENFNLLALKVPANFTLVPSETINEIRKIII